MTLNSFIRPDKWYLGGGGRLLWAPPFPLFLDRPGFWDKAHYYNFEFQPLFTWTLLDERGNEITLRQHSRRWTPADVTQKYRTSVPGLAAEEAKSVLPNDVAVSTVILKNRSRRTHRLHLIAWTAQETFPTKQTTWLTDIEFSNGKLSFTKHVQQINRPAFQWSAAMKLVGKTVSSNVVLSEGTAILPQWKLTPFYEKFSKGKLPQEVKVSGVSNDGILYVALQTTVKLKPGQSEEIAIQLAAGPTAIEARQSLSVQSSGTARRYARSAWEDFFGSVPQFECSDEFISRYYWHRWYGLRLNTIHAGEANYSRPFVCEGIGYFRAPITYSAMCHMLENRWMHQPDLAQGSLLTFIDNQRTDGGFRGYIDVNHYRQEMFYHANWGNSLLQLHAIHPSLPYLNAAYEGLKRYADYFDRERDAEGSGLYDIDNHYETGQEFMHRYTVVNPNADKDNWGEVFRLKGVDATVYIYELKRALARVGAWIGKDAQEVGTWERGAEKIKSSVLRQMWSPDEEMFFDIDPVSGERTMVKAATCFYPYFTDIVSKDHLNGMKRHLFNRDEFWTPYPVPSSSKDDEMFCADPEWKGKRMNCPWNGRVWPMTNSHIAEALAQSSIRFNDKALRKRTAEFITRFIRMMFFDGDSTRPNCFEHYNPINGKPSIYRGIDDYQHSWVVDLIMKYVCGIRPGLDNIVIDPFPFGLKSFKVDGVFIRGRRIKVELRDNRFTVWLDGKKYARNPLGKSRTIPL